MKTWGSTCEGCGYVSDKVSYYHGVKACSEYCARRAWRDRWRRATRAWNREMKRA